ncbi:MAG TPA: hypothetical protein VEB59_11185 [Gemmatimonadales bacterium]|nr:hypothetical protein [Gemmatimonadales bacterium]
MWFFGWMFWLVPLILFSMMMRRRRWEGRHYAPRRDRELEDQRATVDALETRVMQLEERLDFTERLLAGRAEAGQA